MLPHDSDPDHRDAETEGVDAPGGVAVDSGEGGAGDAQEDGEGEDALDSATGEDGSGTEGAGASPPPAGEDGHGDSRKAGKAGDGKDADEGGGATPTPISDSVIERAFKECDGSSHRIALVLGMDRKAVMARLRKMPHLLVVRPEDPTARVTAPKHGETLVRTRTPGVEAPDGAEIVLAIKAAEKAIHEGLEKSGVPRATLEQLRSFGDLQVTTGQFLAQSVIDTQTLYTVELYKIPSMLADIKTRYLDRTDLPPMEVMFWQRAYTELLEQLGKGKDRMIQGAEAIGAMIKDARDKDEAKNGSKKSRTVKPGW